MMVIGGHLPVTRSISAWAIETYPAGLAGLRKTRQNEKRGKIERGCCSLLADFNCPAARQPYPARDLGQ